MIATQFFFADSL